MSKLTDLHAIKARIDDATGADRDLDRDIHLAVGLDIDVVVHRGALINLYTASIDAALALVERLLPGWHWEIGRDGCAMVRDPNIIGASADHVCWEAATPSLALLSALLAALIAKEESNRSFESTEPRNV